MIPVTQTFLPPLEEYQIYLKRIWESAWLTNRGPLVLELEQKLKDSLNVPHLLLTNNGTLPIQIALKLLQAGDEVITTPFSYVATTASIVWEGLKPVFVDIHPEYLCIDESKIEAAITPKTRGILATHVYGNPCAIDIIDEIAKRHNLLVIYDAAHGFGVEYRGRSLFTYGDISTTSFHATKLFHTAEGGALFTNSAEQLHELFYRHNFGHNGPHHFHGVGINAKMSELSAAMGLCVLPYLEFILERRKKCVEQYQAGLDTHRYQFLKIREHTTWNASYFPLIFDSEEKLLVAQDALNQENIFPRRYFYPSLNTLSYVRSERMPVSEDIASRVLCLPLYTALSEENIDRILKILHRVS